MLKEIVRMDNSDVYKYLSRIQISAYKGQPPYEIAQCLPINAARRHLILIITCNDRNKSNFL